MTTHTPIAGLLWLGSAGAALILGGFIALLAANWVCIPFPAQVALALLPLCLSWGGYARFIRNKPPCLAIEEVLGVVWTGSLLCAVALLARILQLSSSSFLFCITMAGLLLPVIVALRSMAAEICVTGFLIAAGVTFDTVSVERSCGTFVSNFIPLIFPLLAIGIAVAKARSLAKENSFAATFRVTESAILVIAAFFGFIACWTRLLQSFYSDTSSFVLAFSSSSIGLGILITLALLDRKKKSHPFAIVGMLALCAVAFAGFHTTTTTLYTTLYTTTSIHTPTLLTFGMIAFLGVLAVAKVALHDEGLFLPVVVVVAFAGFFSMLVYAGLLMGCAAFVLVMALRRGSKFLANMGLIFLLIVSWITFLCYDANLSLLGLLFVLSGGTLVGLNILLSKTTKGNYHV
ncbi:MAG: DUF2157 domain-containing protein [Kiritimatiellia bacterium]